MQQKPFKPILYTLITAVGVPLFFFMLLEISLRLLGFGNGYDYFNELEIDGETFYQENPAFANQFYPPELKIGPLFNTFSKQKPDGTVRIFLLGGSAAEGFPHRNHGVSRHLSAVLHSQMPEMKFEVINTAMTAVNSHVIYQVAKTLPPKTADFAVILLGNNEVVGPYGPANISQNFISNLTIIRVLQTLKQSRIWQLLSSTIKNFANSDSEQQLIWQGMQMFTQQSAKLSDPRLQSVYDHFESNLKDTVEVLEGNGMHVILSTVPVNLRKQAPFSSDHTVKPDTLNLGRWQNLYEQSLQEQSDKNWPATEQTLRKMLEISPDYAESHFQLAVALENQEKWGESREHFFLARDLDTLRFRADSNINRVIRSVAEGTSSEDLTLVDAEQAFSDHSAPSPPGFNLFLEHVHYTVHGNYILAREFGAAILRRLDSSPQPNSISEASISDLIGYPSYETLGNLERLYAMTENPPFKGQSNHRELLSFLTTEISNSKKRLGTTKNIILKRRAILNSPHVDWRIFFELGVLAEEQNNKNTAINFFEKAFEAHPHNRETHLKLANLYSADDQWNKALFYLERSLHYTRGNRNQIAETLGRLGTTQIKLNHFTEGKSVLKRLISNYPDQIDHYLRAHANLVRLAVQESDEKLASDYMLSARSYAEELIAQGEDSKYPELKLRVAQILTMGGRDDLALEWYRPEK